MIMDFYSVMTNYPPFYDLLPMAFSLLSHPESSFGVFTPLGIATKEYGIVEARKTESCPAVTGGLFSVHLDHN